MIRLLLRLKPPSYLLQIPPTLTAFLHPHLLAFPTTPPPPRSRVFSSVSSLKQNSQSLPLFLPEILQFTAAMETNRESSPESEPLVPENVAHDENSDRPAGEPVPNSLFQNPSPNVEDPVVLDGFPSSLGGFEGEGLARSEEVEQRKVLPEEYSKNVVHLECESSAGGGFCDVYLVGTAHVSEESCREVQAIIDYLKPQVVFLELCSSRVSILTPQNLEVPTLKEMLDMWKKKNMNIFGVLYSWFLAKVASQLEVFPGSEFRVALEEAVKYGGKVILGDRPVQITLQRTWGKMSPWHKTKFFYSMIFQALFLPSPEDLKKMLKDMDEVDMLTLVIQEMSKAFPTLMETLVHERDLYMSSTLLRVAREHTSVVAVIGKGHLQGIKKHWEQPVEVKDLLTIPPRKPFVSVRKIATTVGVAVAGLAIVYGIYFAGKK